MNLRTCVSAKGEFVFGTHQPFFSVDNFRENDYISSIGALADGTIVDNKVNFPDKNVDEPKADIIYEIPNPLPFRGTTYINSKWADTRVGKPEKFFLTAQPDFSLTDMLDKWGKDQKISKEKYQDFFSILPRPFLISLANTSTDPNDLIKLTQMCCSFVFDEDDQPSGLIFIKNQMGYNIPDIKDHELFEIIANNPYLPNEYKKVMVLKPGIQGSSEITGEWLKDKNESHVFEYLRRNSYIPWGHFAANTADDCVRYKTSDLCFDDMRGMRYLFYQRTYVHLAKQLKIEIPNTRKRILEDDLEDLRLKIQTRILEIPSNTLKFNAALWGWNFGFGYAHSGYRLHASHQQIHQQYAMIPKGVEASQDQTIPSYACGDMVSEFVQSYRKLTGKSFFQNYLKAIRANKRVDGNVSMPSKLEVFEDDNVLLFVPKAQTSQWELQLMPLKSCGNALEADSSMRTSIDRAILIALQTLEKMGAQMVTSIEFSKRFDSDNKDQQFLYSFLPKLPESPGTFSEAQLRWINGHYPEDFASACRLKLMI